MTPPRQILPGQLCFLTVRCVNRSFRFVPKRVITQTIEFCLAAALAKYRGRIAMHEFLFMSDHAHFLITDRTGCLPSFMEELNSHLSRALNAVRGINGANIEKGYCLVRPADDEKALEHCAYTLANPVKAHLVARCRHWKGASSLGLEYGVPVLVRRPKCGLWAGKQTHGKRHKSQNSGRGQYAGRYKVPEAVELVLERPPIMEHLSDAELRAQVREASRRKEEEAAAERRRKGGKVLGWKKVVAQHFLAIPKTGEEMFGMVPNVSGRNKWARIEALQRRKGFLQAYYSALKEFIAGDRRVVFPAGTWLMKRRYALNCNTFCVT